MDPREMKREDVIILLKKIKKDALFLESLFPQPSAEVQSVVDGIIKKANEAIDIVIYDLD